MKTASPLSIFIAAAAASIGLASTTSAGTIVTLTADGTNSSIPAFGSTLDGPLNDPFAYDCEDPVAVLPAQIYNPGAMGFHGSEPDGADVLVSYTMPELALTENQSFVLDLYGRDGMNDCCAERDDDFDIEFFSGGVGGILVATSEQLAIPNQAPYHLRVVFRGAPIDAIRITARDTDNPAGSYFTLMEIRAAVLIDPTDTDGDGLPDAWEMLHNFDHLDDGTVDPVNGAEGNPDDDGLNNLAELENGTDPRDEDSDDDNLNDGPEVVTGAGLRPPTDPTNSDTDLDGLTDDVETNTGIFIGASDTGSNPTSVDTDMDGARDADEVRRGTGPSDPESGKNLALGGTVGYFDALGAPTGTWGGFPASNLIDGNLATISHTLDQASPDYYCELDLGEEISIGFVELTGRALLDNCCAERLQDATLVILGEGRNEVLRQTLDGQITFTREIDLSAAAPRGRFVQIINTGGFDYGPQIGELAIFGSSAPPINFQITALETNTVTGEASITFNSIPGAQYAVFGSQSMKGLWAEVDDSVDSQGEVTTYEFTDTDLIGQERYFYMVRKN